MGTIIDNFAHFSSFELMRLAHMQIGLSDDILSRKRNYLDPVRIIKRLERRSHDLYNFDSRTKIKAINVMTYYHSLIKKSE